MNDQLNAEIAAVLGSFFRLTNVDFTTPTQADSVAGLLGAVTTALGQIYNLTDEQVADIAPRVHAIKMEIRATREASRAGTVH